MPTPLEVMSEQIRQELLSKNNFNYGNQYSSINKDALSDGDDYGKGENNGEVGSLTDIITRTDNLTKNEYSPNDEYSSNHKNALSDGDDRGKNGEGNNVGSKTDILKRVEGVAKNEYNQSKLYPDFVV